VGGRSPAVFNAANEVAVGAFLDERIRFPEMADVVDQALGALGGGSLGSLEEVLAVDREAREITEAAVRRLSQRKTSSIS
jgi:1-deoxy-D-xylulose-5-phosphate reductoisomerase